MKSNTTNHHYVSPSPGAFPIIGRGPCRLNQTPTQEAFSQMSECGFNVALLSCPDSGWNDDVNGAWKLFYEQSFLYAENVNMSIIIQSAILTYNHNRGVAGNWRSRLVTALHISPEPVPVRGLWKF